MAARPLHDPGSTNLRPVGSQVDSAQVHAELARLAALRRRQLTALAHDRGGTVAAAYRDSVVRALQQIRLAQDRLAAGLHGVCVECAGRIAPERLRRRPSATSCLPCVLAALHRT
ncbi:hypothetical protein [Phycicoccus sp. SLBN-51]|uniref:TraR/DksA family transcriptional regulator n=1 Tax=Phycicoccus sp. SLBN-51 TaxID=2768447 RepID=UPI001151F6C5|nr:hypothetical protein [Phycicoccus sp. SLBN-51]TQJ48590.1 hypothetical protein FBY26_0252 [Phycicoccus sp. SLBN-51]